MAQDAVSMGLGDIIMNTPVEQVMGKLDQNKSGKEWLKKLHSFSGGGRVENGSHDGF